VRDGLHAMSEVEKLKGRNTYPGAIYIMNKVAQDFLVRPMGIFQLIDYVGIDVFQCILKVMRTHLNDPALRSTLVDRMVKNTILGGQYADGTQKDGFLKYERNRPVGIYDIKKNDYVMIDEVWQKKMDTKIGPLPQGSPTWKNLVAYPKKETALAQHFENLKNTDTMGAGLALAFLKTTKDIGQKLVNDGVAKSSDNVNAVLTDGFYWLYGPINDYI